MNPSLVSIIIPVYNSEKYIAGCIESAIDQTWANKEIIVVDDGSADNSYQIANLYANVPGVKIIRQKNKGASAARNAGLREATGDYVQFLDADDLLSPDKIEEQLTCLNGSHSQLAICRTVHFNDGENYLMGVRDNDWFYTDHNNPLDFLIKLYAGKEVMPGYGGMVTVHSWLTPMALIKKAGPWNENLSLDDDGEFFCRVVLASDGIKFSGQGINYYRKYSHQQSLSAQKSRKGIESAIMAADLKLSHLQAKTSNPVVGRIFARNYWWTGVAAYPQFKNISRACIKKAKQLGYTGEKYVGGPGGHLLANLIGWKAARIMAWGRGLLKNSWAL